MIYCEPTDHEDRAIQRAKMRDMWEGIKEERKFRRQLGIIDGRKYRVKKSHRIRIDPVQAAIFGLYGALAALGITNILGVWG